MNRNLLFVMLIFGVCSHTAQASQQPGQNQVSRAEIDSMRKCLAGRENSSTKTKIIFSTVCYHQHAAGKNKSKSGVSKQARDFFSGRNWQ